MHIKKGWIAFIAIALIISCYGIGYIAGTQTISGDGQSASLVDAIKSALGYDRKAGPKVVSVKENIKIQKSIVKNLQSKLANLTKSCRDNQISKVNGADQNLNRASEYLAKNNLAAAEPLIVAAGRQLDEIKTATACKQQIGEIDVGN